MGQTNLIQPKKCKKKNDASYRPPYKSELLQQVHRAKCIWNNAYVKIASNACS